MTVYIYALVDPRNRKVRYIGRTRAPKSRLAGHLSASWRSNRRRHDWIQRLVGLGHVPRLRVLETVALSKAPAAEQRWIDFYRARGTIYNGLHGPIKLQRKRSLFKPSGWIQ